MYYIPIWVGDLSWGVIIAKFAADITFYIPAIVSYELSKKKLRDFEWKLSLNFWVVELLLSSKTDELTSYWLFLFFPLTKTNLWIIFV